MFVVAVVGIRVVAAVIATGLFGSAMPTEFGTLGRSFFTLFQVMTLESWATAVARPAMEANAFAWAFFVVFILATTFTMLLLKFMLTTLLLKHHMLVMLLTHWRTVQ